MCGICGIISHKQSINEDSLKEMCRRLEHRGPDNQGIYIHRGPISAVGLGHKRLAVIDLSDRARQPISNEDNSMQLIMNGEIYNYQQLRQQLKQRGHRFKSNSDAEVVLHLYEESAEDCLLSLRGMFAFAIWDGRANKLFLGRDRLGQKPLLYYHNREDFCFSSEFFSLLASGLFAPEIDYKAIDQYLTFGYVPAPRTIYQKVFKLLPAHYGILDNGKFSVQKYWELDYSRKIVISEKEAAEELIRLLKEATGLRMLSDVPLGAFLSGGIDSSTVAALMSQLSSKVKTFSIGFEDSDYNELEHARRISRFFSTEHHEFIVRPKALEVLPLLVQSYGEPYADSSAIPTYYLSRETRRYVTVALNGDGGDESFAGYERYQAMALAESYNRIPAFFRNGLKAAALSLLPEAIEVKDKRRRLRRFLENVSAPFYLRYCRWICMIRDQIKDKLYSGSFKERLPEDYTADWLRDFPDLPKDMELIDRLMAIDIKTNLANDLMVKMDIASMANSLETRSPFLDPELMQFAASLPANFKLKRSVKKYILKKAIKDLLPHENINRAKMGFGIPVGRWMRKELKDYIQDALLSPRALKRGYFHAGNLKDYVNKHVNGQKDHAFGIWTLLMLELWHQRFID